MARSPSARTGRGSNQYQTRPAGAAKVPRREQDEALEIAVAFGQPLPRFELQWKYPDVTEQQVRVYGERFRDARMVRTTTRKGDPAYALVAPDVADDQIATACRTALCAWARAIGGDNDWDDEHRDRYQEAVEAGGSVGDAFIGVEPVYLWREGIVPVEMTEPVNTINDPSALPGVRLLEGSTIAQRMFSQFIND